MPQVATHPARNLEWAASFVRAPTLLANGAIDEATNVSLWRNRILMDKVFQESAVIKASGSGRPDDQLRAAQWAEQGRINELFYQKAVRDLDRHRGADDRATGDAAVTEATAGHDRGQEPPRGYTASASGRVQTGRHKDVRAAEAPSTTTPPRAQAAALRRSAGTEAQAVASGPSKCSTCHGPLESWYRLCPACGTSIKQAARSEAPEPAQFYQAESVASDISQQSHLSVADMLLDARQVEKEQAHATRAYLHKLNGIWMEQHMASAGARLDSFVNGTAAEKARGVGASSAKERRGTAAVLRPDRPPPEHWLLWEAGLTGLDLVGVGTIRTITTVAECDPPQAVADLTDKMVAVIDRAEAASSGFHGPSQRLALESPRSEAATTHVDEAPPRQNAEDKPMLEVQAILAQCISRRSRPLP